MTVGSTIEHDGKTWVIEAIGHNPYHMELDADGQFIERMGAYLVHYGETNSEATWVNL